MRWVWDEEGLEDVEEHDVCMREVGSSTEAPLPGLLWITGCLDSVCSPSWKWALGFPNLHGDSSNLRTQRLLVRELLSFHH